MNQLSQKEKQRLQALHDSLPKGLAEVPNYLIELARNQRKLQQIRKGREGKDMTQTEKKVQGSLLQNFKKGLIQMDSLHKKSVVELKSVGDKLKRLENIYNN